MKQFKIGDRVKINPVWEGLPRAGTGVVAWVTREREFTPEHIATAAYGDAYTPARCRPTAHPKYFVRRDNPRDPEHPFLVTISTLPLELISEVELNTGTNMTTIQLSIGEWKMRNGEKARVEYEHKGLNFPWHGYIGDDVPITWRDNGLEFSSASPHDIIAPWTSPIAPGHNPDKLTVEQVGEGYWLPEWEVLDKMTPEQKWTHLEVWGDDRKWCGHQGMVRERRAFFNSTYRTRLSSDELLKLIAPKKRLIRVEELPAVCWVGNKHGYWLVTSRNIDSNRFCGSGTDYITTEEAHSYQHKYSSDLKTWHSFEVEDKE